MHPNLKHSNGTFDNLSFKQKVDQSIRYFKVPSNVDKEDAFDALMSRIEDEATNRKGNSKIRTLYFTIGSVAAAACVVLFFAYSFFMVETYTDRGDQFASNVVYLPDNSRVVLGDGAELKYSKLFKQRRVQLKGQAYFEVEKGDNFYVKTSKGGVLVIGTRFSVSDLNDSFDVHCFQGLVGVDIDKQKIKLTEGMTLSERDGQINVSKKQSVTYPEFAVFDYNCSNVVLSELLPIVERYFGIEIHNETNLEQTFTGQFHTGNVEEVIEIVCTSMNMSFDVIEKDFVRLYTSK